MTCVLGKAYRDSVTGFEGVCTARAEYLAEAPSVRLTMVNGNQELEERWIAEGRMVEVGRPSVGFTPYAV